MQLIIKKQIGKTSYPFTVEGKNLFECVMEAEKLSFPDVFKCGVCESDHLRLKAYITKDDHYEYVKIICSKCGASVTFGRTKQSPDTFYLRRREDGSFDWQKPEKKKDDLPF